MDFTQLDVETGANNGAFCHLYHPTDGEELSTDEGDKIGFQVLGRDSQKFKEKEFKIARTRVKHNQGEIDFAKASASYCTLLAEVSTPKNILVEGENLEDNKQKIAEFFARYTWAQEQVDAFIANRSNFLPSAQGN